ncbi:MFS transporter [Chloroflexota bacterium]
MTVLTAWKTEKALPIISVITFIGFLDTPLLIPVIALYAAKLGSSIGIIGIIVGLYSLTNTLANIFFGRLVDRFGYRMPLFAGLIGDAVSMFLYSLCRLPVQLALVRVLHGISGGVVGPATMSAIAEHSQEQRKGRGMAFYGIALAAATLVGYGLSGFLASSFGFRVIFWMGAGLLIFGVILSLFLPNTKKMAAASSEVSSAGSWAKIRELLARRELVIAYMAIFAQYFTFGGVVTLLPLYVKGLGMEALHVGILMAIFAVVFLILQFPVGILSDRMGRIRPIFAGIGLSAFALVVMSTVNSFAMLAIAMAIYGIAYGTLFPSISAVVVDNSTSGERGIATGIFHAMLTSGVALGAPLMGWIGEMAGVRSGLLLTSIIMIAALLIILGLARGHRQT